jgi:hypothetical protein
VDLTPVFGVPLGAIVFVVLSFLILILWIPSEILHKAGFARGWAFLTFLIGPLALIILALIEWPIHRELAWHRLRAGGSSGDNIASVERYAVDLEKCGEWKKAEEVFEDLARRAPSEEVTDYYLSCLKRLHEKMGAAEVT